jgi:hypothetical protein
MKITSETSKCCQFNYFQCLHKLSILLGCCFFTQPSSLTWFLFASLLNSLFNFGDGEPALKVDDKEVSLCSVMLTNIIVAGKKPPISSPANSCIQVRACNPRNIFMPGRKKREAFVLTLVPESISWNGSAAGSASLD